MSRLFTSTADHLDNAVPAVTATPFTLAAWVKFTTTSLLQDVLTLGQAANSNNRWSIGQTNLNFSHATARDATTSAVAASSLTITGGAWQLLTGVFTDDSNRASYLNGANKGTSAGARPITAPTATRVSGQNAAGANSLQTANVAHLAIWNIVLSDSDVLSLYTNLPSSIQVANLLEYWPLNTGASPEPSLGILGNSLTVTGTSFSVDDPFGAPVQLMGQAIF